MTKLYKVLSENNEIIDHLLLEVLQNFPSFNALCTHFSPCLFFFLFLFSMVYVRGWLTLVRVVRLIMGGEKMSVNQSNNGLMTEKYKSA